MVACQGVQANEAGNTTSATQQQAAAAGANPFDAHYPADFRLNDLSADPVAPADKPALAQDLGTAFTDPAYGTRIYRASDASNAGGQMLRHNYSRRQAFNADSSRYLMLDGSGAWYLHDAQTFQQIRKLDPLAGDSEAIWHASDPNTVYFTARNGGTTWWSLNVNTGEQKTLFDFTGKTPWPEATSFWTGKEGTTSADGRYISLMATRYDEASQRNKIYGILTLDIEQQQIVGTLDAKDFPVPHAYPDHISTSASGKYAVPSWGYQQGGTRAYSIDFTKSIELSGTSEHSDLAFGPEKQDYYVFADYVTGQLTAIDLDTQQRIDLRNLYPASGEAYALHISGQAFDRPGWAVVSTYGDSANYTTVAPSPELRAEYRKVWLVELKPGGRVLDVAHIRSNEETSDGTYAYFLEPQASVSRDLSRIIFASNFGVKEGPIESYIVGLPSTFDK